MNQETIEIKNGTDKSIVVSACRSELSGMLYIELGSEAHGDMQAVAPNHCEAVNVQKTEL